jgi:hypothetical protein
MSKKVVWLLHSIIFGDHIHTYIIIVVGDVDWGIGAGQGEWMGPLSC